MERLHRRAQAGLPGIRGYIFWVAAIAMPTPAEIKAAAEAIRQVFERERTQLVKWTNEGLALAALEAAEKVRRDDK